MTYYRLRCETHKEDFMPLLATEPGEMLAWPNPEDATQTRTAGASNIERGKNLLDSPE